MAKKHFEYLILEENQNFMLNLEEKLNNLGKHGWELVNIVTLKYDEIKIFLKKEV